MRLTTNVPTGPQGCPGRWVGLPCEKPAGHQGRNHGPDDAYRASQREDAPLSRHDALVAEFGTRASGPVR